MHSGSSSSATSFVAAATSFATNKPTVQANAVRSSIGDTPILPLQVTLSALSALQRDHVRALLTMINNQQQDKMCVGLPNGAQALATKEGRVYLAKNIILGHVLFVPKLTCNLISVSKMIDDSRCFVYFTDSLCAIQDNHSGSLIGADERIGGLYYIRQISKVCAVTKPEISAFELWHRRLGHPSDPIVKLVPAISTSSSSKFLNKACEVCRLAKQSRDSFPNSDSRASRIFEMIHCDLLGSNKTSSTCGAHYFLTIVDYFSRAVWVYLLNNKTEVYSSFCSFFTMVKCQFDVNVKCVRSDNGTEFKHMIPCLCFAHNQNEKGDKFSPRSRKSVFVGHPHDKKGWKLYDLDTSDIFVSRDVIFHENTFPFISNVGDTTVGDHGVSNDNVGVDNDFLDDLEYVLEVGEASLDSDTSNDTTDSTPMVPNAVAYTAPSIGSLDRSPLVVASAARSLSTEHTTASTNRSSDNTIVADPGPSSSSSSSSSNDLGRGHRERHPPGWHCDYVAHTISLQSPSISQSSPPSSSSSGNPYPLAHFVNCDKFSMRHCVFIVAVDTVVKPRNFKEAMQDEGWREAMQNEIRALEDNHT
ncbi:uncharacterized protein LOC110689497 [Chenopodium quinoa]|uniref:uncharacterized protein LOC110689497 n=1 Tax=Chenopodium quinoa TaxID=63459 RepID=UPI000B780FDB|nr:uncharacterized protein LOC110689497 [Chenopodium quinoa]